MPLLKELLQWLPDAEVVGDDGQNIAGRMAVLRSG